jgi:hypothetical protein
MHTTRLLCIISILLLLLLVVVVALLLCNRPPGSRNMLVLLLRLRIYDLILRFSIRHHGTGWDGGRGKRAKSLAPARNTTRGILSDEYL